MSVYDTITQQILTQLVDCSISFSINYNLLDFHWARYNGTAFSTCESNVYG